MATAKLLQPPAVSKSPVVLKKGNLFETEENNIDAKTIILRLTAAGYGIIRLSR